AGAELNGTDRAVIAQPLGFQITAHRIHAAGADLLAAEKGFVRVLTLNASVDAVAVTQGLLTADIDLRIDILAKRAKALQIDLIGVAARGKGKIDRASRFGDEIVLLPGPRIGQRDWIVEHRRIGRGARGDDILGELLAIDADREGLVEGVAPG